MFISKKRDEDGQRQLDWNLETGVVLMNSLHLKDPTKTCYKLVMLLMEEMIPVDMENIPLLTRLHTSQVVQDFFHQQYFR